ncbi:MAG: VTT domain-containing protein [bacterium]
MIDFVSLVPTLGYAGLFTLVFLESGVFFGFFLPGDSVLFSAGLLASQGFFNIALLVLLLGAAAILGDSVGYWFGTKIGKQIFNRHDSFCFKRERLKQVQAYYKKYGAKTIIIARFIPVVRTFAPILAGVGEMPYQLFVRYNIVGGVAWSAGVTLLGYFLGSAFPATEHYLLPIIMGIILLSLLPIFIEWYKVRYPHR